MDELNLKLNPVVWKNEIQHFNIYSQAYNAFINDSLPSVILIYSPIQYDLLVFSSWLVGLMVCETQKACAECEGCQYFLAQTHPDVLWLSTNNSVIKISEINELQEHLKIQASSFWYTAAKKRIAVLHNVEKLNVQASNRLLKTLEEPPDNSMIILTAQQLKPILPTVKSRCVLFKVKNLQNKNFPAIDSKTLELATTLIKADVELDNLTALFELIKDNQINITTILPAIELVLNNTYKQMLVTNKGEFHNNIFYTIIRRRELLSKLRKFATKEKIPINNLFALESMIIY